MNPTYSEFITCYECSEDVEVEFTCRWDEGGNEYAETDVEACPCCGDADFMGGCGDDGGRAAEKRAMMAD